MKIEFVKIGHHAPVIKDPVEFSSKFRTEEFYNEMKEFLTSLFPDELYGKVHDIDIDLDNEINTGYVLFIFSYRDYMTYKYLDLEMCYKISEVKEV